MKYMYLNIAFRRKDTVAKRKYNNKSAFVCLVFSIESRREIFEIITPIVYSFLPII